MREPLPRIGLIGAGFIAGVHAEAIAAIRRGPVSCVVDPDVAAARRIAEPMGARVFSSVEDALAADGFDRAHVLVPPALHAEVALPILRSGRPVLLEKPMAATASCCAHLAAASGESGTILGVNQNFVFHPAFVRLRELIERGEIGRPNFLSCTFNVPLRQMAARQFSHWMFRAPVNILLEQAVHPLSQITVLAGAVRAARALAGPPVEISPGLPFFPSLSASLDCERMPVQFRFAVGQSFPFWQITVVGDDGTAVADILSNHLSLHARTRWLEAVDRMVSGLSTAGGVARDSLVNAAAYVASTSKLTGRRDPFFRSMRDSIAAFHNAVDTGEAPELGATFGASLVTACEMLHDSAFPRPTEAAASPRVPANPRPGGGDDHAPCDVALLGGTGFIGTHVVRRLVAEGKRVSILARSARDLDPDFTVPQVSLHRGDIRDPRAVAAAIGDAAIVVNLAHGGGGRNWEEVRATMVGGAETVAKVCQERGVARLVHVSSIAALYLGPQELPVTGRTGPDPHAERRADYARAKAACDSRLLEMHARDGLPVCILRPGVVVGEGSTPFHTGTGFFNTEQHCIGWNDGRNPLPFVLVEDVADAIIRALSADGVEGHCYNLVGDVRLSAREYIAALGHALERPLRFHPQRARWLWAEDFGKWSIKRVTGRKAPLPSLHDFLSRGMKAEFDCSDAKRDLGWQPMSDPGDFTRRAILVHRPGAILDAGAASGEARMRAA